MTKLLSVVVFLRLFIDVSSIIDIQLGITISVHHWIFHVGGKTTVYLLDVSKKYPTGIDAVCKTQHPGLQEFLPTSNTEVWDLIYLIQAAGITYDVWVTSNFTLDAPGGRANRYRWGTELVESAMWFVVTGNSEPNTDFPSTVLRRYLLSKRSASGTHLLGEYGSHAGNGIVCHAAPYTPTATSTTTATTTALTTTTSTTESTTPSTTTTTTTESTTPSTTTTRTTTTTRPPYSINAVVVCPCQCPSANVSTLPTNISREHLQQLTDEIQNTLSVDHTQLSSHNRKKNSADDGKKSSMISGYMGIVFLALTFGIVVILDLAQAVNHICHRGLNKIKKRGMKVKAKVKPKEGN